MSISDQQFRDEFKPLHVPAHYIVDDSDEDKIVFALAQIEQGSADDAASELAKHDSGVDEVDFKEKAKSILHNLYEKGLIKGEEIDGVMQYNLSKITHANDGAVNPDLLAPGLD